MGGSRAHFERHDVKHPIFTIECKARTAPPKMVQKWMAQAEAAREDGKDALLVIHEQGAEHGNDLAVMRLSVLRDLVGS